MTKSNFTIAAAIVAGALAVAPVSAAMADERKHSGFHKGREKNHHAGLRIPPGHRPRPGECRIWYPGKPPGHQPRPGNCRVLGRRVPPGAWLISHDKKWSYADLRAHRYTKGAGYYGKRDSHDDRYPRGGYDGRSYSGRREIRKDIRDVRAARSEVRQDREQLQKNIEELKNDKAELRKDIRDGAKRKEIRQGRREIRQDRREISGSKKDLRQSQNKLEAAREELREDLRRR
ncbi:MAG: hypothetical protein ACREQ7_17415 [Candidatus Binatia bacterium]